MLASGTFAVESHTWDMHAWMPYEPAGTQARPNMLPLAGESEAAYAAAVKKDLAVYDEVRRRELGDGFRALAYPSGEYTDYTEILVHEAGIPVTFSTRTDRRNILVKGLPQTLYALCRYAVDDTVSGDGLLAMLGEP